MTHTLKLKGDLSLPGLALPEAFQSLDSRLDSVLQLCSAKGSPEAQLLGVVTVCEELKQLLKCAFIENGMLASRIEILTRYQMESVKKMDKKLNDMDMENKVTHKHMKRFRRKLSAQQVLHKKRSGEWWDMAIRSTDYESFITLSRAGGYPDLEFMLRVNQLMIDFVSDSTRMELVLPPMGLEERQEVSKLASIYKLRCRYGKSVQIAPSTLLKARQACVPAAGEVDAILNTFTRSHVQRKAAEGVTDDVSAEPVPSGRKEEPTKPSSISLPSTMLTPISNLPSPTVDMTSFKQPSHSPPSSGLATPTEGPARFPKRRDSLDTTGGGGASSSSSSSLAERRNLAGIQSASLPGPAGTTKQDPQPHHESKKGKTVVPKQPSTSSTHPTPSESQPPTSTAVPPASPRTVPTVTSRPPPQPPSNPLSTSSSLPSHPLSPVGIVLTPALAGSTRSPGGGILVQSPIRGAGATHSTVLASPIKCHPPQPNPDHHQQQQLTSRTQPKEKDEGKKRERLKEGGGDEALRDEGGRGGGGGGGGGGGSARTDSMGPPAKRVRVTRRSVAEEEQTRQ